MEFDWLVLVPLQYVGLYVANHCLATNPFLVSVERPYVLYLVNVADQNCG